MRPTFHNHYAIFTFNTFKEAAKEFRFTDGTYTKYRMKVITFDNNGKLKTEVRIPVIRKFCDCPMEILIREGCKCGGA